MKLWHRLYKQLDNFEAFKKIANEPGNEQLDENNEDTDTLYTYIDIYLEAIRGGHLQVAKWLEDRFDSFCCDGVDRETAFQEIEGFFEAIAGSHFSTAEWIFQKWENIFNADYPMGKIPSPEECYKELLENLEAAGQVEQYKTFLESIRALFIEDETEPETSRDCFKIGSTVRMNEFFEEDEYKTEHGIVRSINGNELVIDCYKTHLFERIPIWYEDDGLYNYNSFRVLKKITKEITRTIQVKLVSEFVPYNSYTICYGRVSGNDYKIFDYHNFRKYYNISIEFWDGILDKLSCRGGKVVATQGIEYVYKDVQYIPVKTDNKLDFEFNEKIVAFLADHTEMRIERIKFPISMFGSSKSLRFSKPVRPARALAEVIKYLSKPIDDEYLQKVSESDLIEYKFVSCIVSSNSSNKRYRPRWEISNDDYSSVHRYDLLVQRVPETSDCDEFLPELKLIKPGYLELTLQRGEDLEN